eukprot:1179634-Prorocentrum_minimum.AAC.2
MVMWLSRGRSGRGGRSGGRGRYSYVTHRSHGARSALLICHAPLWGQERARGQKRRARACLQHSHAQKLRMHDMVTCAVRAVLDPVHPLFAPAAAFIAFNPPPATPSGERWLDLHLDRQLAALAAVLGPEWAPSEVCQVRLSPLLRLVPVTACVNPCSSTSCDAFVSEDVSAE